jgi:hypothetical protein
MRKLRNIFVHTVSIFRNPQNYFEDLKDNGLDSSEALMISFFSALLYGVLNSIRTLISNGIGEYATITNLSEATSAVTNNILSGFLFFLLIFGFIFVITHIAGLKAGLKKWKTTSYVLAYFTPAINVYIGALIVYEMFRKFVVGFPLIKYVLALVSLAYIGYILARGLEAFHEISYRKAIWIAASPILVIIAIQVILVIYVMVTLFSAL